MAVDIVRLPRPCPLSITVLSRFLPPRLVTPAASFALRPLEPAADIYLLVLQVNAGLFFKAEDEKVKTRGFV